MLDLPYTYLHEDDERSQESTFSQALVEFYASICSLDGIAPGGITSISVNSEANKQCSDFLEDCVRMCELIRKGNADNAFMCVKWLIDICSEFDVKALGCARAYANALRQAGAIATDMYLAHSSIRYHIQALEWEVEALRKSVISYLDSLPDDREDCSTDMILLARCLNAVAVSSYRLRNYSVALPLIEIACRTIVACGVDPDDKAGQKARKMIIRNRSVIRYAYAQDIRDCLTGFNCEGESVATIARKQFPLALEHAKKAEEESGDRNWDARITVAECQFMSGENSDAISTLNNLKKDITDSIKKSMLKEVRRPTDEEISSCYTQYITLARCCYQLSRFIFMSSQGDADEVNKALNIARESFLYRCWVLDYHNVDVKKSHDLVKAIEDAARGAKLRPVESTEEFRNERRRVEDIVARNKVPSTFVVVDQIIRGNEVSACDVLGVDENAMANLLQAISDKSGDCKLTEWKAACDKGQSDEGLLPDPTRLLVPFKWDIEIDRATSEWKPKAR